MGELRANPAPLGLMGFGMTTVLLNFHNAGFFEIDDVVLAMGIFYGGLAQIIAGVLEYRRGNTFGLTAFTSYGFFWLTLVYIVLAEDVQGLTVGHETTFMGWYLFMWGVFTAYMFVGTLYKNRALQVVFGSLTLLFLLLAIGDWFDAVIVTEIAGFVGILCGFSAIYLAAAEVLNDSSGRTMLPIGPVSAPVPAKEIEWSTEVSKLTAESSVQDELVSSDR